LEFLYDELSLENASSKDKSMIQYSSFWEDLSVLFEPKKTSERPQKRKKTEKDSTIVQLLQMATVCSKIREFQKCMLLAIALVHHVISPHVKVEDVASKKSLDFDMRVTFQAFCNCSTKRDMINGLANLVIEFNSKNDVDVNRNKHLLPTLKNLPCALKQLDKSNFRKSKDHVNNLIALLLDVQEQRQNAEQDFVRNFFIMRLGVLHMHLEMWKPEKGHAANSRPLASNKALLTLERPTQGDRARAFRGNVGIQKKVDAQFATLEG